ncbi:MAG: calcium/sodium antiporter [Lachnospiraceae bacterium]|nr:calcium/sodium antiporter [Lachnospiraceae bacterium]
MSTVLNIFLLIVGFVALIKGADMFVDGSAALAKNFKVPGVIIGLTIVAMGTSAPELAVSVSAAAKGSNAIAISNVVGSNLFNMLVVLGVCALISTVPVDKAIIKRDFPFNVILTVLLFLFPSIKLITGGELFSTPMSTEDAGILARWAGILFLVLFVAYIGYLIYDARKNRVEDEDEIKTMPYWKCAVFIVVGIACIVAGGQLVVENAKAIARTFGMSETLIGLTIIAVGTSLPELVTSVVAAKKGENGLAVGNVVGSNIFNILLILGASATIHPIVVSMETIFDLGLLVIFTIITYVLSFNKKISRAEGAFMLIAYIAEVVFAAMR